MEQDIQEILKSDTLDNNLGFSFLNEERDETIHLSQDVLDVNTQIQLKPQ